MNKKIFILIVIMFVMTVFLQFLNGEIRPAREPHNINRGFLASHPEEHAGLLEETYNVNGVWLIRAVVAKQNLTWELNAFILGREGKCMVGISKNLDGGFRGDVTVDGDLITIDCSPYTADPGIFTGTVANANYMSGTWFYSDGSVGGTWEGTRNSLPASPNFDIRGNWLIGIELKYKDQEYNDKEILLLWIASFYESGGTQVFKFMDVILGEGIELTSPPGEYSISGDEVTINYKNFDDSYVFTGKIINGDMLNGTFIHTGGIEGYYERSWAAILWALPGNIPPFGSFDTPLDGAAVSGSIAVTGWALANRGIDNVKIYREEASTLVYVGDAVFVEGARPDVAEAYPFYASSEKAGWGYMLLTNFLPNGGNGTFVLHAIATDLVGNATTLGTKTIYCDNAHAVKPFGALDTPGQGGTASGSNLINWGWVLTPQPNYISIDGSTINVIVDGINIGHPNYNIYRDDIANLFPGYFNSNGAVGYFNLDTTVYANGVHTIQWTATDSAGNRDGIGSRYFTIDNSVDSGSSIQSTDGIFSHKRINGTGLEISSFNLIEQYLKLNNRSAKAQWGAAPVLASDPGDILKVIGKELEPVEVSLGDNISEVQGYQLVNNQLRNLPVGSTLDARTGKFYWSPGPGFLGKYSFVFEIKNPDGRSCKKSVEITLEPKFKGPRRNH
jgi:hypothetical protein